MGVLCFGDVWGFWGVLGFGVFWGYLGVLGCLRVTVKG